MQLPVLFFKFWYLEAPKSLLLYMLAMDNAFLHLLSIPLFLRTFFKPVKNEYRGDLVKFSIVVGMLLKTVLIIVGLGIFFVLLLVQLFFYLVFLALPILPLLVLFINI